MNKYVVKDIQVGSGFSRGLYLDKWFILTTSELPFSQELRATLLEWRCREVSSIGSPKAIAQEPVEAITDTGKMKEIEDFFVNTEEYMKDIFMQVAKNGQLDYKTVADKVQSIYPLIQDPYLLLNFQKTYHVDVDYSAFHAVTSMVISIIIGLSLKLPENRLIELGVAALFHEIGMIKLVSQSYFETKKLTLEERKALYVHPVVGYNMLKSFNFPLPVCLAALEHHERENGKGYPQKLAADKISLYAKIIGIACSYDAIMSHRPYKQGEDSNANLITLFQNKDKGYNSIVVKALLLALSPYPVGLYVLLSNGKKARVVDVQPENLSFPVVQVLGEEANIQTSENGITITRILNRSEVEPA
ncbi:MAG: HD-GYP domain-containing protein [Treponema sp.]|jgi:HD-GYP domain-containing protein (c-di-GMP phosphodiesterase class II)|nr:HD-GYP domain-containing protein [Treponema sp.]